MQPASEGALRTRVYIDGYNLYYGCLKNTADKWLDLRALAMRVLANVPYERNGEPVRYEFRAPAIKYFTAPILSAFARADDSVVCQSQYHAALRGHLGGEMQIFTGYHDARPARAHAVVEGKPAGKSPLVDIWKLEEKQSDVALALHAFCDAVLDEIDQVVVMTNDSDFAPAMQMIRQHNDQPGSAAGETWRDEPPSPGRHDALLFCGSNAGAPGHVPDVQVAHPLDLKST